MNGLLFSAGNSVKKLLLLLCWCTSRPLVVLLMRYTATAVGTRKNQRDNTRWWGHRLDFSLFENERVNDTSSRYFYGRQP